MMKYKPVLFLDFDGVLHPNGCAPTDCFCLLPALAATITPFELDIVISSSWRFHRSLRFLKKLFPVPLRKRIVGTTGEPFPGTHARWKEIRAYLHEHPASSWRALDDFDFEFPPDCRELIHCDGARGCQSTELELLATWLSQSAG
jgi:HAD domain in Swiss Army Knife RNA repair proteins